MYVQILIVSGPWFLQAQGLWRNSVNPILLSLPYVKVIEQHVTWEFRCLAFSWWGMGVPADQAVRGGRNLRAWIAWHSGQESFLSGSKPFPYFPIYCETSGVMGHIQHLIWTPHLLGEDREEGKDKMKRKNDILPFLWGVKENPEHGNNWQIQNRPSTASID